MMSFGHPLLPRLDEDSFAMAEPVAGAARSPEGKPLLFGKYELGKLLGCGAFAKVYHGRDARSGQSVAIKAISKARLAAGKGGFLAAHVKREVAIMRRLRHPHIVRLYEILATKTKIYFVMEFAKGGELFKKVAKGRFCEDLSRRYFQQLISAIGYCHSRGVFHRDLKPENLLLDENLDLKITDFGLSAVTEQVRPDGMLHTLCGTPAYVAPEILANRGYDGAKIDVWSCGVVLFVLNAGYLPFNDPNLMVMYRKIYKGEFRVPRWTSPELKRLLLRLLDTNPRTRITVDEIINDPWFKKGYEPTNFLPADTLDFNKETEFYGSEKCLNAFEIISLSPGFNLSGMFGDADVVCESERFSSAETPEKILKTVEEVAGEENVTVRRNKGWGMRVEGPSGHLIVMEVHRLTDELVMVEVRKRRRKSSESGRDLWTSTLKPRLYSLIHQPMELVDGDRNSTGGL